MDTINYMKTPAQILSENLQGLIQPHGRMFSSQAALAKACGLPQRSVNRVINLETDPGIETLTRIADGIGVEFYQLFLPQFERFPGLDAPTADLVALLGEASAEELSRITNVVKALLTPADDSGRRPVDLHGAVEKASGLVRGSERASKTSSAPHGHSKSNKSK